VHYLRAGSKEQGGTVRDILTGFAILLLLCLTGALIAPHFISWESHRERVSSYLSEAVGQRVQVNGTIGITLFPTPTLKLTNVVLGHEKPDDKAAVSGEIGRLRLVGSIPPLLRGELKISSVVVDSVKLVIRPHRLNLASGSANDPLRAISIESLQIRNSAISLHHADGTVSDLAKNMNGQLEAASLVGPFKGGLSFMSSQQMRTLRFSTGRIEQGIVRLKALIENETAAARSEFDGQMTFVGGQLSGEGKVTASGNASLPLEDVPQVIWRMTSKVRGNLQVASFDDIELALGQGDKQTIFAGNGDLDSSRAAPARFTLSTRQIDVDQLLGDENQRLPKTPEALLRLVSTSAGSSIAIPWLSGEFDLSAGSVILGRGIIVGPRVVMSVADGVTAFRHLTGELPGQTMVALNNGSEKPATLLSGELVVESREFGKLNTWFHGVPSRQAGPRSLRLAGTLLYTPETLAVTDASVSADEFKARGSVALHRTLARPKLELRLNADQLDIARLPTVADFDGPDSMDFDVVLDAKRVQFAGVGAGVITVKARREDGAVILDSVSIKDLGGATLQASGGMGRADSSLKAELDATNLDVLLQLASRLSAHPVIPALAARANALVPARLVLNFTPDTTASYLSAVRMDLNGRFAETDVSGFLRLNENAELLSGRALELTVATQTSARLLQQIGLEAIRLDRTGGARLHLVGDGFPAGEKSASWSLKGEIANVSLEMSATRANDPAQPLSGRISLDSQDLSLLAQTLLISVPTVTPGQSLKATADFDLRGYKLTLRDLDARSGSSLSNPGFVRGELAFNLAEFGRVAGQLQTSELDIRSFAPLIFGATDTSVLASLWSRKPFGKVAPVTLPGDLWIDAQSVRLGDDLRTDQARFVLRFENGLIYLEHADVETRGAKLKGAATLRRLDKSVSLTGRIGVSGGILGDPTFENMLRGKFDGDLEFNGIADSPASLVASLSGTGRAKLLDANLVGVKHGVLGLAVRSSLDAFDATRLASLSARLRSDFDGTANMPAIYVPVVLAGGVLKAGPIPVITTEEELATNIAVDLKDLNLLGEAVVRLRERPKDWDAKDWDGGAAFASVIWQGPIANPVRRIESTALANGLTAMAITRESQRIELLEQGQRERAALTRQPQLLQEDQRQLVEEKRKLEEARRLQAARRKLDEENRQRPASSAANPSGNPASRPLNITPSGNPLNSAR
jgi:hypothetical protein